MRIEGFLVMPNKRALIVDDSSTAQYRLKKLLRGYNLDIDTADSGEAALRYLAHQSADVIFMDHLMPGMDGCLLYTSPSPRDH
jgi:CheY-like chemotaxis protein